MQLVTYLPVLTILIGILLIFVLVYRGNEKYLLAKAIIIGIIFFLAAVFAWFMTGDFSIIM
jgi:hypothetical protein